MTYVEDSIIIELEKRGWILQVSFVVGSCRLCHKEIRGTSCINSPKGTSYHIPCAAKREHIIGDKP